MGETQMKTTMTPAEIIQARRTLMLDQVTLAKAIGVSRPAVLLWESGKRQMPPPAVLLLRFYVKYPGLLQERLRDVANG